MCSVCVRVKRNPQKGNQTNNQKRESKKGIKKGTPKTIGPLVAHYLEKR